MNRKKTIVFLHAMHEPHIKRVQESLLSYCRDNNFTIIKTIIADEEDNCQVLTVLINLIKSQNAPINLIVTINILNNLFHIFTYTVIATLLEAGLIRSLYIYQDDTSQTTNINKSTNRKPYVTKGKELLEVKINLLPFCAEYYKAMVMLKEIETFYDDE